MARTRLRLCPAMREDHGEPVGIERRLVEDLRADPVSAGDLLRPGVVLAAVAHQSREERTPLQLREIRETHEEGQQRGPRTSTARIVPARNACPLTAPPS